MSRAAIVELQPYKLTKDDWVEQEVLFEDPGILYHCDYVGDQYDDNERQQYIREELPKFFYGIADVDPETETIKFYSKEKILDSIKKELDGAISFIRRNADLGDCTFYNLRYAGRWFRRDYTIFWSELASYTSAQFIENCIYCAEQTMYIGAIYSYHI